MKHWDPVTPMRHSWGISDLVIFTVIRRSFGGPGFKMPCRAKPIKVWAYGRGSLFGNTDTGHFGLVVLNYIWGHLLHLF